jgi:hypothetical protein
MASKILQQFKYSTVERLIIICRQCVEMHAWVPPGFFSRMAAGKFAYRLMLKYFLSIPAIATETLVTLF